MSEVTEVRVEQTLAPRFKGVRQFWQAYKKNRAAVAGLLILCVIGLMAIFGPYLSPNSPWVLVAGQFMPPSTQYLMGTDNLGRDVLSGVLNGAQVSLFVGFIAAAVSTAIGIVVGAYSGYYGGRVGYVLMKITEYFQVLPRFIMALIVVVIFGASLWNVIWVIAVFSWPVTARLVRAEYLTLKEREFVEAARALGASDLKIIFGEILPNAAPPIIVNSSLQVGSAILTEAGLSFLGLGDPSMISWGYMLYNAQRFLRQAWWMATFPGLGIFLTVVGVNLVGDGLNDALNPKLREGA